MTHWGAGYVTDTAYTTGWYRQQAPAMMAVAALLGGVAAGVPRPDEDVHVLELGCGRGYVAMLQAACNPRWRVTAVDFNPAHIAEAREWATEAGLNNIAFLEADLATLADEPAGRQIPAADFVTMHGVWSWVPPSVQAGIVRLLRDKVRPGGVVHISYNTLPGWGPAMGMQRLLREAGRRSASGSVRQVEAGRAFAQALHAAGAAHLVGSSLVNRLLPGLKDQPVAYVAHEFMNESWRPCFMSDVAAALSDAKLEFVASSQLIENFLPLVLSEAQQELMCQFDDPLMRELVKDMCFERLLRHDVYVRGARRISSGTRDDALSNIVIGLTIDPDELPQEVDVPAGKAELNPSFYQPIVRALSKGPARVGDLLNLSRIEGRRDNPAELVGMLVGLQLAEIMLRPSVEPGAAVQRFNQVAISRFEKTYMLGHPVGIGSHAIGAGVTSAFIDLLVGYWAQQGLTGTDELLVRIDPPPQHAAETRTAIEMSVLRRLPVLRNLGVF